LQPLAKIFVIELFTERSKRRGIDMWTAPGAVDRMTLAAQSFKQGSSPRLSALLGIADGDEGAQQQCGCSKPQLVHRLFIVDDWPPRFEIVGTYP
jgi:hypothetical protein